VIVREPADEAVSLDGAPRESMTSSYVVTPGLYGEAACSAVTSSADALVASDNAAAHQTSHRIALSPREAIKAPTASMSRDVAAAAERDAKRRSRARALDSLIGEAKKTSVFGRLTARGARVQLVR
jgi:hypothetical protein